MSGIAGMGEAEELLSFDMFNNADPRTPLRDKNNETNTNDNDNDNGNDNDNDNDDDDETNTNTNNNMSYGSMSYGSMSMSMNDDCSTTAGGSTRSSTRSSRRRNKRKNKENNSSSNSFVSQNSSFLNSNSSVIIGGGNSKSKNPYLKRKEKEIDFILSQSPNIDLWKLRELALTPGGLVNGKFLYNIYISFSSGV
jgi:hypothetical protein